jgi:hypothetical protein
MGLGKVNNISEKKNAKIKFNLKKSNRKIVYLQKI